jgi:chemosensory pili system protein ChpA (sensor histidine kinase/response regulator)
MAATLLDIEDALDSELVRAAAPSGERQELEGDDSAVQLRMATQSVIGECIVNLARIKEAVVELVEHPGDVRALDQVGPQLRGITAGLMMLGKTQAVAVVERIGAAIVSRLSPGQAVLAADLAERLADAVVSLEYYLETVSAGRRDPWYMLDNAERCLDLLDASSVPAEDEQAEAGEEVDDQAETMTPAAATVVPHPVVMEVDDERSDPELVDIFIEEAKEEVANIRRHLPAWQQDRDNSEALIAARRSFHTLKGSGRMIGAQVIGEFAWNVENLLNRIINHTLSPSDEAVEFLSRATEFLPQLIEQLEIGTQPADDADLFIEQAHAYAEGDVDVGSLVAASTLSEAAKEPTEADGEEVPDRDVPQMDPVLADIFVKEMRGHLKTVRDSLSAVNDGTRASVVEEPLFRASHTLLGSANMAGFEPAIALTSPLAEFLAQKYESGSSLNPEALHALSGTADMLEHMADALSKNEAFAEDATELIAQLMTLARPEAAVAAEAPPVEPETSSVPIDFDPEIAAIFTEEAAEILENAELALQEFRSDSPASECLVELQRLLHTLKGGARMAGITPMGDLSHSLEDLLSGISASQVEPTAEVVDVVQQSLDQLHQMRDAVGAGQAVSGATELLAAIQSLASSGALEVSKEPLPETD